jgi:hypothetical protein
MEQTLFKLFYYSLYLQTVSEVIYCVTLATCDVRYNKLFFFWIKKRMTMVNVTVLKDFVQYVGLYIVLVFWLDALVTEICLYQQGSEKNIRT